MKLLLVVEWLIRLKVLDDVEIGNSYFIFSVQNWLETLSIKQNTKM